MIEDYFERLDRHTRARDLLVQNRLIYSADVQCFVSNVPKYLDCATHVVVGTCVEQYRLERIICNDEFNSKWGQVVVHFVDVDKLIAYTVDPEYVKTHKGELLPARPEFQSGACYRIDLSDAIPKPLEEVVR